MIATLLGPLFSSAFLHLLDALIARLDMPVAPFTFLYLCMITRWNDGFDRCGLPFGWIGQKSMNMPSIWTLLTLMDTN